MFRSFLILIFVSSLAYGQEAQKIGNRANQDIQLCKNLGGGSESCLTLDSAGDFTTVGDVGIGTASPAANTLLTIEGDGASGNGGNIKLRSQDSGTGSLLGQLEFGNTTDDFLAMIRATADGAADAGQLSIWTEATGGGIDPRVTILSGGNVGIGTETPSTKLEISKANTANNTATLQITDTDATGFNLGIQFHDAFDGAAEAIRIQTNIPSANNRSLNIFTKVSGTMTNQMVIPHSGNVLTVTGALGTISDGRTKTNIRPIANGLDVINSLNPVHYDWKHPEFHRGGPTSGFIAQEVAQVLPELVATGSWKSEKENAANPGIKQPLVLGLGHDFKAYLVKAIQELSAKVSELEDKAGCANTPDNILH